MEVPMTGNETTFSDGDRVVGIGGRVGVIDSREQGGWRVQWEDGTVTTCGAHMLTLAPPDRVTQAIISEARENAERRRAAERPTGLYLSAYYLLTELSNAVEETSLSLNAELVEHMHGDAAELKRRATELAGVLVEIAEQGEEAV
jgi:hypothetical protein